EGAIALGVIWSDAIAQVRRSGVADLAPGSGRQGRHRRGRPGRAQSGIQTLSALAIREPQRLPSIVTGGGLAAGRLKGRVAAKSGCIAAADIELVNDEPYRRRIERARKQPRGARPFPFARRALRTFVRAAAVRPSPLQNAGRSAAGLLNDMRELMREKARAG